MRVFLAIIVGTIGVVLLLAGVKGSGQQLFSSLFGSGAAPSTSTQASHAAAAAVNQSAGTTTAANIAQGVAR